MVFLCYRWMGYDYWGYWCNDCTLYFYERIYFIINCEICKIKYSTAHHICRHFWDTYCLLFILRQHTILDSKETTLFGCTEPLAAIISSVLILHVPFQSFQLLGLLCHCNGAHLKSKPDEGKPELKACS